jgi:hypothetical protein
LKDAKINWQAEAGKTGRLGASPNASITRRRNEIATGEKKYLRAAYLSATENPY